MKSGTTRVPAVRERTSFVYPEERDENGLLKVKTDWTKPVEVELTLAKAESMIEGVEPSEPWALKVTEGAITGYESIYVTPSNVMLGCLFGWCACAGTPNRWDGLTIPAESMRQAYYDLGILYRMELEELERVAPTS